MVQQQMALKGVASLLMTNDDMFERAFEQGTGANGKIGDLLTPNSHMDDDNLSPGQQDDG